jgi:hypothetical protein
MMSTHLSLFDNYNYLIACIYVILNTAEKSRDDLAEGAMKYLTISHKTGVNDKLNNSCNFITWIF